MSLTKIFNRTNPASRQALDIFRQLWEKADDRLRASLENFALDHRVPDALEEEFMDFVLPPDAGLTPEELRGLLTSWVSSYKATCLLDAPTQPSFLAAVNSDNRVDHLCGANASGPRPPDFLVTIIKSKYMGELLPDELALRFPDRSSAECHSARAQFDMHSENSDLFKQAFCEAWRRKTAKRPQHPKWAADLAEFDGQNHRQREPGQWEMLFGKEPGEDTYIVALCGYPLSQIGEVYRPNIIDANANHLHYPSPPWLDRTAGGLTVALGACRAHPSLSEFIHHDVAYAPEHFLLFKLHDPSPGSSPWQKDRATHRQKLKERYPTHGQTFEAWQNCTDPT